MALPPVIADTNVTISWAPTQTYYGYCTIADVRAEFPNIANYTDLATVGATSSSIIGLYISYAAQEMQDQLAPYYQMPYVGTDGGVQLTLRMININLAVANLIEHYTGGSLDDVSKVAQARRSYAELLVVDIQNGKIQLAAPFGDAVRMAESPQFPRSALQQVQPNPSASDGSGSAIFSAGRSRFNPDRMM